MSSGLNGSDTLAVTGRWLVALAVSVFGYEYWLYAGAQGGGMPGPLPQVPKGGVAIVAGVVLILSAVCLVTRRWCRWVAIGLGLVSLSYVLLTQIAAILRAPHDPEPWTHAAELTALGAGAFVIAGVSSLKEKAFQSQSRAIAGARVLFASALPVFGVQHILYARYVATLVPNWIPGHLFWAYFVGVVFVAAALALVIGIWEKLTAILLGTMFLCWFPILHVPRVIRAVHNPQEWTSAFVDLAMSGCSYAIAASFWSACTKSSALSAQTLAASTQQS